MNLPEIAAIIPCHNGEVFLDGAIQSVLAQTHPVAEVIVVDDASEDGTRTVADSYVKAGYPVSVISLGENSGPATARNRAIAISRAPFLAFLDADDRWDPDHCATLGSLLREYPDAVLAYSRTRSVASNEGIAHSVRDRPTAGAGNALAAPPAGPSGCGWRLEEMLHENLVPQSAVVVRRDALLSADGYTDGLRHSEDYDLWLRLARLGPFAWTGSATCTRTLHDDQVSRDELSMFRGAWRARRNYWRTAFDGPRILSGERYEELCRVAYDRDVREAWRSRSFQTLSGVLQLGTTVPGAAILRLRWYIRAIVIWPAWRVAAWIWDGLRRL